MSRTITGHIGKFRNCQACHLGQVSRDRIFYSGTIPADLIFVGTAPTDNEAAVGFPFTGRLRMFFEGIMEDAFDSRWSWVVTHSLACVPKDRPAASSHEPRSSEYKACSPRLFDFIQTVQKEDSRFIALGNTASKALSYLRIEHTKVIHPRSIMQQEEQGRLDYTRLIRDLEKINLELCKSRKIAWRKRKPSG